MFGSLNRGSVTAWNEWMHLSRAWSCERAARGARRAAGGGGAAAAAVGRQSVAPRAPSPTLRARSECHAAPALIKTFPHWDRSACLYAPRTDNESSRRRDTVTRVPLDTLLNTCVFVFHMWFAFRFFNSTLQDNYWISSFIFKDQCEYFN